MYNGQCSIGGWTGIAGCLESVRERTRSHSHNGHCGGDDIAEPHPSEVLDTVADSRYDSEEVRVPIERRSSASADSTQRITVEWW